MSQVALKKCLIVDDEIVKNEDDRENFLADVNLPREKALFARSYEEALAVFKKDSSSIALCFLDCIIPKTNKELVEKKSFVDPESDWGLKLIPFLKDSKSKILVYSAHLSMDNISLKYKDNNNIIGYVNKSFLKEDRQFIQKLFKEELDIRQYEFQLPDKNKNFSYDFLEEDIADFIKDRANKINFLSRRVAKDSVEIGKYLIEVKEKLDHGDFLAWIKAEFPWGKSTAYRLMPIAQKFPNFGSMQVSLSTDVLHELSKRFVPQEAVDEVFERAKEETIPKKVAVEIIEKYSDSEKNEESSVSPRKEESLDASKVSLKSENDEEIKPKDKLNSVTYPTLSEPLGKEATDVRSQSIPTVLTPSQPIQIVNVQHNLVKNSYWQIGDRHRLFCGSPENSLFIEQLPPLISLVANYSPDKSGLLEDLVDADTRHCFQSKLQDIDPKALRTSLKSLIFETVPPEDTVVFAYIFDPSLFDLAVQMECICYAAEPNLDLCEQILDIWRKKGSTVKRIG